MKKIIIHSYFTEGYFDWAKLLIKSLKKTNGDGLEFIFSSRNLDEKRQKELYKLYSNLTIINKNLNYGEMAKRAGLGKKTILQYKKQVETEKVNKDNKVWKLMIAAEDRLKEVQEILNNYNASILHLDVDTYVRKDITPILETIVKYDFTTRWRIERQIKRDGYVKRENRATLISVQGYNGSSKSKLFLQTWLNHLCSVQPQERPLGFGQTSCYYAYLDLKNKMSFGDIPESFLSSGGYGHGILWGANKGKKKNTLKKYEEDYEKS